MRLSLSMNLYYVHLFTVPLADLGGCRTCPHISLCVCHVRSFRLSHYYLIDCLSDPSRLRAISVSHAPLYCVAINQPSRSGMVGTDHLIISTPPTPTAHDSPRHIFIRRRCTYRRGFFFLISILHVRLEGRPNKAGIYPPHSCQTLVTGKERWMFRPVIEFDHAQPTGMASSPSCCGSRGVYERPPPSVSAG